MAYENLLKSVDESAEEREKELRERALRSSEDLKAEAAKKADLIRKTLLETAAHEAEIERNKQVYLTKAEIKEKLIEIRENVFLQAFTSARQRLEAVREDPKYEEIFRNLAIEAFDALDQHECTVHIDIRDEQLCRKTLAELHREYMVVSDLKTMGGLTVNSSDGSITISNTLESRLDRGRERLKQEVYSLLSGG